MANQNGRQLCVNLAVKDVKKSMVFFSKLGFEYNPKLTDDKAACMLVSSEAFVMLLSQPFFETFTKRPVCDTSRATEALLAVSCGSRQEVDDLVHKAIAAGGGYAMERQDHGFMYGWSFYDLDGHHWEVFWMSPEAAK